MRDTFLYAHTADYYLSPIIQVSYKQLNMWRTPYSVCTVYSRSKGRSSTIHHSTRLWKRFIISLISSAHQFLFFRITHCTSVNSLKSTCTHGSRNPYRPGYHVQTPLGHDTMRKVVLSLQFSSMVSKRSQVRLIWEVQTSDQRKVKYSWNSNNSNLRDHSSQGM